jgi:hypothetical protein
MDEESGRRHGERHIAKVAGAETTRMAGAGFAKSVEECAKSVGIIGYYLWPTWGVADLCIAVAHPVKRTPSRRFPPATLT